MHEDAITEQAAALRAILRRRAPEIEWHTVHCVYDREAMLWVRIRAMHAERRVQFVVIVPQPESIASSGIAARILTEALRLLRKQN